jgi:hypothetical protein
MGDIDYSLFRRGYMKRLLTILLIVPLFVGCAAVVIGGGAGGAAYFWFKGALVHEYDQPLPTVYDATQHAMSVLSLPISHREKDGLAAELHGRTVKGDRPIVIAMERMTETRTKVAVRVGELGDRQDAQTIHDEIGKALR